MKKEDKKMKKYKLIKKYPGSPASLGLEINKNGNYWQSNFCTDTVEHFHKSFNEFNPTDYPEFWQEIIEKDYEIISFIFKDRIDTKRENGFFGIEVPKKNYQKKGNYSENSYSNDCWNIYSVKRLCDGEIFTIGDKCNPISSLYKDNIHTITKFELIMNNTQLRVGSLNWYLDIKGIEKSKQPLFKTEDGKEIFHKMDYYHIISDWSVQKETAQEFGREEYQLSNLLRFSTEEKAKEFIIINKPCLSINDVNNAYPNPKGSPLHNELMHKLRQTVKSKI